MFFFSSRRRHTRCLSDWSSDVCSSDLLKNVSIGFAPAETFFRPSRTIACARTVAVVVPSPATSFVEIGRASCRERVYDAGRARAVKEYTGHRYKGVQTIVRYDTKDDSS